MTAYSQFVARLLFPLHERLKGHNTNAVLKDMERVQWLPTPDIEALQLDRLRLFLTQVGATVPYYRELFKTLEFDPSTLESIEQLQTLPLLDKVTIKQNTDALKAENASQLSVFNTGGSSGEPLVFYLGKERVSHDVAAKRRATRWWDVDIGDKEIVIWGSPIELSSQDRVRQYRDKLFRTQLLSAFDLSPTKLDEYIAQILRVKPRMLFGYPSAISSMAEHARNRGVDLSKSGVAVVFVTSERLYDHQREVIESSFNAPVANGYGGRDAGFIAHQCKSGGMHVTADDIIVEIVDEGGKPVPKDTPGEIVVTHMRTPGFPFIRYRTGDVAELSSQLCACGRGLPLLENLQGRSTDFIYAADGTKLHGLALIYVLRELAEIKSFRIIQKSHLLILVELVSDSQIDNALIDTITNQFKARLGSQMEIRIEQLESIPAEKSGKYRYVKCEIDSTSDGDTHGH
jgi:phenylacetate-CoA ligase